MRQSWIGRVVCAVCLTCTLLPLAEGQNVPASGVGSASTQRIWRDVQGKFEVSAQLIELRPTKSS